MNRCALCLQMLRLLKARGMMSRQELADELQTNIRNLSEFRKELETAGYVIESTTGRYGGYRLVEEEALAVPSLNKDEQTALLEACAYLQAHKDFAYGDLFMKAMDKIRAGTRGKAHGSGTYLEESDLHISARLRQYLTLCREGIARQKAMLLQYRSLQSKEVKEVTLFPYELVYYQNAYYVIGYALHARDFRTYKFSEERMKACTLTNRSFTRDRDFTLRDHVGIGLMKDQVVELRLSIYDEVAVLVSESRIGLCLEAYWQEDGGYYMHLLIDGEMRAEQFLLSLGSHVELHEPKAWRKRIYQNVQAMLVNWKESGT